MAKGKGVCGFKNNISNSCQPIILFFIHFCAQQHCIKKSTKYTHCPNRAFHRSMNYDLWTSIGFCFGLLGFISALVWMIAVDFEKSVHEIFWSSSFSMVACFCYFRNSLFFGGSPFKDSTSEEHEKFRPFDSEYQPFWQPSSRQTTIMILIFTWSTMEVIWAFRKSWIKGFEIGNSMKNEANNVPNYILRVVLLMLIMSPIIYNFTFFSKTEVQQTEGIIFSSPIDFISVFLYICGLMIQLTGICCIKDATNVERNCFSKKKKQLVGS